MGWLSLHSRIDATPRIRSSFKIRSKTELSFSNTRKRNNQCQCALSEHPAGHEFPNQSSVI